MLAREQRLDLRVGEDRGQEAARDIALQQAIAIFGEHRHVPHRRIHRQADEPAEQHVVGDLLHQLPFRADREQGLQQQRPQQLLGRDRGPAGVRVDRRECRRQPVQRRVHQQTDRPQRMVLRYQALRARITEQLAGLTVCSAHPLPPLLHDGKTESNRSRI